MLVAQGLNQTVFTQFSRLPAYLASMEGLLDGGLDATANGVIPVLHMDAQPAKLLLHLQHLELAE